VKAEANANREALLILIGPLVWAAHFFAVYLAEAILCSLDDPGYGTIVRALGLALSIVAVSFLIWMRFRSLRDIWPSISRPLIDLSIVAIVLSSIPLLLLRACHSAGA
jgi:hypothetical protein